MNQAGFVAIALVGLWIAYLVPHRLRFRQQLLESRADDRFSERLRVLRVARPACVAGPGSRFVVAAGASAGRVALHPARGAVVGPVREDTAGQSGRQAGRVRPGGRAMNRPHATGDRISADAARRSAAEHARRVAYLGRRSAAARRRAALTAVLLLAVAGGWSLVGTAGASILLGAVPTALLVGVLGLGRRAVVAGARADAAWGAGAADRVPLAVGHGRRGSGVVGRAVHPSDATTEVLARVPAVGATATSTSVERRSVGEAVHAPDAAAVTDTDSSRSTEATHEPADDAGEGGSTWAPVPVPPPAYTLKPVARRAEPAPLVLDDPAPTVQSSVQVDAADGAPTTGGLSLDAILARRRASGE